jgi:gamma-glutamylcyclotransferase (GGCT)/AIG2-like uncharacterized protein YtfP
MLDHDRLDRLAVYGTLAPGEPNHDQLAACPGTWVRGTVHGWRGERAFPVFTFDPAGPAVTVHVLHSAMLPAHWARLDAFEGDDYVRLPVPVELADGTCVVANLYAARAPVSPAAAAPARAPRSAPRSRRRAPPSRP